MTNKLLITLFGLALAACATPDQPQAAAPQAASIPATPVAQTGDGPTFEIDPDDEICRRVEQTGTRFHSRVCKTRAEWAREAHEAQETTRQMQRETAIPQCVLNKRC